jgi:nitroreductase
MLDLATVDHLLCSTRSVRKRLDFTRPVAPALIERCIEIALQAPTGSNAQGWHFVVVTDAKKRGLLADLYRKAAGVVSQMYGENPYPPDDLRADQFPRMRASGAHFVEHLHQVPVLVVPCFEGRVENAGVLLQATLYGSILPAAWSFMLALRAHRTRMRMDHEPPDVRARGRGDSRTARPHHPGSAARRGLLHRHHLQASKTLARQGPHPLERLGTSTQSVSGMRCAAGRGSTCPVTYSASSETR